MPQNAVSVNDRLTAYNGIQTVVLKDYNGAEKFISPNDIVNIITL